VARGALFALAGAAAGPREAAPLLVEQVSARRELDEALYGLRVEALEVEALLDLRGVLEGNPVHVAELGVERGRMARGVREDPQPIQD
jgi:hypothetical protein